MFLDIGCFVRIICYDLSQRGRDRENIIYINLILTCFGTRLDNLNTS